MEFRILGPLEVWDAGHEVSLGGPRPRALLEASRLSLTNSRSSSLRSSAWSVLQSRAAARRAPR